MKTLNEYPDIQTDRLFELKMELLNTDYSYTKIGSARLTVDDGHDIPVLRLRINDNFPTARVRKIIDEHQMQICMAFIEEKEYEEETTHNLVVFVGNP